MAAASSGAGLPEHAASVPAGSSSSGSGSRRGGATRAVLGVALTGVAVALAVVFGGGHAGGSAGKSKQAALPAFDTMADGAGASSPPLAGGVFHQATPPAPVTDAQTPTTTTTTAPATAEAGEEASKPTTTAGLLKAQADTLANAKHPVVAEEGDKLLTAGGALFGHFIDPRIGCLIDGCTPSTGLELKYLVENTTCPVITLVPGGNYTLREYILVMPGRRVSVIGRPLNMPTIDAHRAYRSFTVEPGAVLDLRWVRLFRGKPIRIIRRYYYEIRGGGVYIRAGGTAVITGCLFTVNPVLITEFLLTSSPETTVRMLGGYLLMEAGTLTVTDCHFYVTRPGVLFREVYTVGGSVLILGGNALFTGCTFTSSLLFVNVVGVGDAVGIFGGNAVFTGCAWTFNCALVAGYGVGFMMFVGGGTVILTGVSGVNNMGANAFFGSGNGIFCGGGVVIMTGVSLNTDVALFAGAGVGAVVSLGGGVMIKTGVSQTSWTACQFVAFLGVAVFVGSGTVVESECNWARVGSQTAFYGGGGSLYLGSGVATVVNCNGFVANIVANVAAGGGHIAIPAGFLTMVNTYFYKFEVITAHYGQGFDVLILAGGAVFVNSGYGGRAYALFHGNPGLVNIWVAGNTVELNKTYHGAYVDRKGVDYFRSHGSSLKMRHVRLDYKYNKAHASHGRTRALHSGIPVNAPSKAGFEPRHLQRIAQAADAMINSFLDSAAAALDRDDTALPELAAAAAAANAVVPPVGGGAAAADEGTMQRLPWPGMNVEIPQAPAVRTTDNVFIAGPLDSCSLCDVSPGLTGSNFDGAGLGSCTVAEDCDTLNAAEQEAADKQGQNGASTGSAAGTKDDNVIMWNPPGGLGAANTSVAILTVTAVFTPKDKDSGIAGNAIKEAVQAASEELGLPQRYLIRAAPELPNPLMFDNDYYAESVLLPENAEGLSAQDSQKGIVDGTTNPATDNVLAEARGATPLTEEEINPLEDRAVYAECSRVKQYKIYLVSDWRNVTQANARGLRGEDAEQALTDAVAGSEEAQKRVAQVCSVGVTAAQAMFVPAIAKKVFFQRDDGSGVSLDPAASSIFTALNEEKDDDVAASVAAAAAELVDAVGEKVVDVRAGETYALRLQAFKPNHALITLKLTPADGVTFIPVGALHTGADGTQTWQWVVPPGIKPGAYYIEASAPQNKAGGGLLSAALPDDSRFAFTQAFSVLGAFTG